MLTRAAVLFEEPGKWEVTEVDLEPPRQGDLLVRIAAAGLCHSDDHVAYSLETINDGFEDMSQRAQYSRRRHIRQVRIWRALLRAPCRTSGTAGADDPTLRTSRVAFRARRPGRGDVPGG
jgi:hypothetical protein